VKRNSKASGSYGMGETTPPYAQREVHRQSATRTIYEVHKKTQKKAMETRIYIFNSVTHWFLLELSQ
jgi:hypothetical protein